MSGFAGALVALCSSKHTRCRGKGLLPFAITAVTTLADRNYASETSADISPR